MSMIPVGIPVAKSGWICPKCGRVYSPEWPACDPCNNDVKRNVFSPATSMATGKPHPEGEEE